MTEQERMLKAKIPGEETGIEIQHSICDICTGIHCGLDAYVKDDVLLKVEGTEGYPINNGKLCTKGASNRQYLYRQNRIKTPLKRIGPRGSGEFKEISWDEALDEIAAQLNKIKATYGPESVAWFVGYPKWPRAWVHRLTHSFGSTNFGAESSTCHTSILMAWETVAGQPFRPDFAHNSDLYVGWGNNTMINEYTTARTLIDFKKRGGKIIIIDSRNTATSQKLSDEFLKIHPGTDGALAWGVANYLIENNLYDKAFVEKYAHGFEEYRAYAKTWTLEKTSEVTGIPVEQIRLLGDAYAKAKKVSIYAPSATIAHNRNGYNTLRAILCLQVITGNMDREGTELPVYPGLILSDGGFPTMQEDFEQSLRPKNCKNRIAWGKFPVWDALVDEFQLADYTRQVNEETPYPIKGLMAFGMNHRMYPQPQKILDANDKLDFVAAADIIMTDVCRHADIVLPTCTSMERRELKAYGGGYLTCTQQCVHPLYESRPDTEIVCELSKRLGLNDPLLAAGYEETMRYLISNLDVTLEELEASPLPVKVKEYAPHAPGELLKNGFKTKTGKLELYSELIRDVAAEAHRADLDPLPVWYSGYDDAPKEEYPFTLIAGSRIPNAIHSRMHECMPWPRTLRPNPAADIHPEDAARLNIASGDRIALYTPKGEIEVEAHVTAAGSPGDIYMFHGYAEADVNKLIPDVHLDPYSGFPGYNLVRCGLRKAAQK